MSRRSKPAGRKDCRQQSRHAIPARAEPPGNLQRLQASVNNNPKKTVTGNRTNRRRTILAQETLFSAICEMQCCASDVASTKLTTWETRGFTRRCWHVQCKQDRMSKSGPSAARGLGLAPKMELHQHPPDAHSPFSVKRMSWSWFSAELVRIQPAEFEFRVKGDASYLALHDYVRSDGETTISGGSRSTLADGRDKLTFAPIGSSVEGWNCFKLPMSSAIAVHLAPPTSDDDSNDISTIPPSLYFENSEVSWMARA